MAEGELMIDLVPDEQALEEMEKKQLEITGEADSVEKAREQNEQQNQRLGAISRGITRLLGFFVQITAVLAAVLVAVTAVSDALDISFRDVRNAIVNVLQSLVKSFKDSFIPTTKTQAAQTGTQALTNFDPTSPGLGLLENFGQNAVSNLQENTDFNLDLSLLTSRDQMLGDSTQQDKSAHKQNQDIFDWGS